MGKDTMETGMVSSSRPRARFFIAACVVLALMGIAHLAGSLQQPPPRDETERQLLDLMTSYRMDLVGTPRSMMEIFKGFSHFFEVAALGMALTGLMLASGSVRDARVLRRVSIAYVVTLGFGLVISLTHWFIVPTAFIGAAMVLFAVSAVVEGRGAGVRA